MKKHAYHLWKGVLVGVAVLMVLISTVQALETAVESKEVTLSATVRNSAGSTGTFDFTFELEEFPSTSAVMNNYSMLPPEPSAVPEPSTLVLVGLGVLGLALLQKKFS